MSSLKEKLDALSLDRGFTDNVTRWEKIAPSDGIYEDIPEEVSPVIRETLLKRGIPIAATILYLGQQIFRS